MNSQGIGIFCARRIQVGLTYGVQIAVINGEITSAKYTFYLKNPPESYEAKKGDENFWKVVDMAVDLLSSETKIYDAMWDTLSPEFVEILRNHKIYRDGGWERLSEMSLEELEAEKEKMKKEHPELQAEFETIDWMHQNCQQYSDQQSDDMDDIDYEETMKAIKKAFEDISGAMTDFLKGENLL